MRTALSHSLGATVLVGSKSESGALSLLYSRHTPKAFSEPLELGPVILLGCTSEVGLSCGFVSRWRPAGSAASKRDALTRRFAPWRPQGGACSGPAGCACLRCHSQNSSLLRVKISRLSSMREKSRPAGAIEFTVERSVYYLESFNALFFCRGESVLFSCR